MSATPLKVLVVGAGVGGLSAGLALRGAGAEVALFERAEGLEGNEGGHRHGPMAERKRALERLGVANDVESVGASLERLDLYAASGELLNSWDVGEINRHVGAPSLALNRGDLHSILADAYRSESPISFGSLGVEVTEEVDGVSVRFQDGRTERGDLLVGAERDRLGSSAPSDRERPA